MITDLLQIGKITFQFTLWITLQIHSLESDQIDYKFESIWLFIHFVGWNNEKSVCFSIIDKFNALFDEKKWFHWRNSITSEKFDSVKKTRFRWKFLSEKSQCFIQLNESILALSHLSSNYNCWISWIHHWDNFMNSSKSFVKINETIRFMPSFQSKFNYFHHHGFSDVIRTFDRGKTVNGFLINLSAITALSYLLSTKLMSRGAKMIF